SGEIDITLSIGIAWTSANDTVDGLLAAADAALYTAKRNGRNKVVYAPECNLGDFQTSTLHTSIRLPVR
ncbi:MAG TPA: diguanylate cyclase, partial [Bacteroidales bacterium]|nr:diguanylate cyclase [Bacteroidales bacterium]